MAGADTGILELPYKASADVHKMRFVRLTGDETVADCNALGQRALGVAKVSVLTAPDPQVHYGDVRNEVALGKGTAVQVLGVAFVEASAAIARDAEVTAAADGRAVTAAAGHSVNGKALKAAAAAGDWIPVLLAGGFGRVV